MIRIFLCIPLPPEIRAVLKEVQQHFPKTDKIRCTFPDNFHITIFFIGEIFPDQLQAVKDSAGEVFNRTLPFQLHFRELAFAGKPSSPSMVWARFEQEPAFAELAQKLRRSLDFLTGIPGEEKEHIPHITLARMKKGVDISAFGPFPVIRLQVPMVTGAELWQTLQTPSGVRYSSLEKFSFGA